MLRDKAPNMLKKEVQIDEVYIGRRETNKHLSKRGPKGSTVGRRADAKTPVIGIVETGGKVAIKVCQWVTKKNVQRLIDQYVGTGSPMVTDGYVLYAFLKHDKDFTHKIVDHKKGEYVKDGFHANGIENSWSLLKRGIIGIYHYVSPEHLQRYCDEFAARFNSRKVKDYERFEWAVQNSEGSLKYNDLIRK